MRKGPLTSIGYSHWAVPGDAGRAAVSAMNQFYLHAVHLPSAQFFFARRGADHTRSEPLGHLVGEFDGLAPDTFVAPGQDLRLCGAVTRRRRRTEEDRGGGYILTACKVDKG